MAIEIDNIYNMDCLEGMKMIPDKSVDCIICDLPYGVTACKWDSVIPLDKLWEQYLRIAKEDAAIILFGQGMFTADLMKSQPKLWRYNLIWDKVRVSGFLNSGKMPLRSHEDIAVFYRKQPTYNPQKTHTGKRNANHNGKTTRMRDNCYGKILQQKSDKDMVDYKLPTSIVTFTKQEDNNSWSHPTQKPLDLLRYLVLTYSNEGDTILDNTCGSGTTCVAAYKEHRHYIGFELNKEYYDKAVQRINRERQQLSLF